MSTSSSGPAQAEYEDFDAIAIPQDGRNFSKAVAAPAPQSPQRTCTCQPPHTGEDADIQDHMDAQDLRGRHVLDVSFLAPLQVVEIEVLGSHPSKGKNLEQHRALPGMPGILGRAATEVTRVPKEDLKTLRFRLCVATANSPGLCVRGPPQ